MKKIILFGAILTLVFTSCRRDKVTTVSGTIINSMSNEPMKDVEVMLYCKKNCEIAFSEGGNCDVYGRSYGYSDDNGYFYVETDCRANDMRVFKEGYKLKSQIVHGGKDNIVVIKLDTFKLN